MIVKELDQVVVRFSGDSGDGMQLAGNIKMYKIKGLFVSKLRKSRDNYLFKSINSYHYDSIKNDSFLQFIIFIHVLWTTWKFIAE